MKSTACALLGAVALAGCSVVGIRAGTEEPVYALLATLDGDVEIRRYEPRLAAQTTVSSNNSSEAFRILAGYIFGKNKPADEIAMTAPVEVRPQSEGEKIAMTAPVSVQEGDGDGMRMRFFLPSDLTLETAPRPLDDRINLVELPAQTIAVMAFTDFWGQRESGDAANRLLDVLRASPWTPTGPVVAYYYDPPWTIPFLRRNEVAVPVAQLGN